MKTKRSCGPVMRSCLLLFLLATASTQAGTRPIEVILLAGQSNMVGYSDAALVPAPLAKQANILFYDASPQTLTTPTPVLGPLQVSYNRSASGNFGPEITFGSRTSAAKPGTRFALVKYAFGGSFLAVDPNSWDITLPNNLYQNFNIAVANALSALSEAGYEPRIAGMLWLQGESDSYSETMARAYQANLTALIADVRRRYGKNLPFVIGGIGYTPSPHRPHILQAQANLAKSLGQVEYFGNDDLNTEKELHFTGADMLTLGERFAAAYQALTEGSRR